MNEMDSGRQPSDSAQVAMIAAEPFPVLYLKNPIKIADLLSFAEDTLAMINIAQGAAQDNSSAQAYSAQFSLSVRYVSEFSGH